MTLAIRPAASCRYDVVSLGEVMLRLDPGEGRIRTASHFQVWEGGGEYNVARGLSRCFGLRAGVVTALADNEIGRLVEGRILAGGVDTSLIRWVDYDGVGRTVRNGLNFTERGFGVRGGLGVSDRGHTATSQLRPGDIDWDHLFGRVGVRWLHTGGVFCALSASTAEVAAEAMGAARRHGTVVSYDPNYRASLWQGVGGRERAQRVDRDLAPLVDVMIGLDGVAGDGVARDGDGAAGVTGDGVAGDGVAGAAPVAGDPAGADDAGVDDAAVERLAAVAVARFPNLAVVATTRRSVLSANRNDWSAVAWSRETGMVHSTARPGLEILDRIGGGDSFASGLIYGLLTEQGVAAAVEYGAAHGALAMTTPGDASMASLAEVQRLINGASGATTR